MSDSESFLMSTHIRTPQLITSFLLLITYYFVKFCVFSGRKIILAAGDFKQRCEATPSLPLTTYHLPLTTYHLPLTTYHLPLTTYHLPLTTYHLPLTTYHLPFTIYNLPFLKRSGKEIFTLTHNLSQSPHPPHNHRLSVISSLSAAITPRTLRIPAVLAPLPVRPYSNTFNQPSRSDNRNSSFFTLHSSFDFAVGKISALLHQPKTQNQKFSK